MLTERVTIIIHIRSVTSSPTIHTRATTRTATARDRPHHYAAPAQPDEQSRTQP